VTGDEDDKPLTRRDLGVIALKSDLASALEPYALKADLVAMETRLTAMMKRIKNELLEEIAKSLMHVASVISEQQSKHVIAVDEKYKDLPPRVATLETHAADSSIHVRPTTPPKRTRRK
jgi:hypothetical protein